MEDVYYKRIERNDELYHFHPLLLHYYQQHSGPLFCSIAKRSRTPL